MIKLIKLEASSLPILPVIQAPYWPGKGYFSLITTVGYGDTSHLPHVDKHGRASRQKKDEV